MEVPKKESKSGKKKNIIQKLKKKSHPKSKKKKRKKKKERKLNIELQYNLLIPLLGIYPEKTIIQKDSIHPSVHCSSIYNSQDMEAT